MSEPRAPALEFVLPGDPAARSGGYGYDRRMVAGLRSCGWRVTVHALDASFPAPTPAALASARSSLARLRDGALVLIDGLALGAMPQVVAAEAQRLRLVALVHHPLAAETGLSAAAAAALERSERAALESVRRVVVTSCATREALRAYGVAPERIDVVVPGTDAGPLARGSGAGSVRLLCVAALIPRKGHALLIEALAGLQDSDWELLCVGSAERDPAHAALLRRQIAERGLGARIRLAGELDEHALAAAFARADAFVLATLHEGYGMAVAEALAHGLPVVSTCTGAIPEIVPREAGFAVPPGDAAALRRAIGAVVGDAALRARLARGAARAREALPAWSAACVRMADALCKAQADDGLQR